ncbi:MULTISPECIES: MFS transporter [unclassified Plantactinospora]|uniref:MFS transporter n=1 Tax=unclassified Plantactinospora TaxID=2631981 RepID=UPI000D1512F5|nr:MULTISPECIES: MFS transporter [unclassified Plantactinospora]AVT32105.1 MFS transporter [Plantactinospora sp. BC1]AVT40586.1 MFS transporter [Plantactinospora sp. BB1]
MTGTLTPPVVRRRRRWLPELLRQAQFRRYWSAQTVSLFGDEISVLALPLLAVLSTGAGPAEMGYLTAAALTPSLLFSLLLGAWIDRYPHKRRVMVLADLGRAVLLATVPVAYLFGVLSLGQLYVVAFLTGTLAVLFEVAHSTLFVSLVPRKDYVDANALTYGSRAMSFVAGPSVGGLLVQTLTAPVTLLVDAVSYLVSALFLARIRLTRPTEPASTDGAGLGLGQGLRFVVRAPILRSLLLGTTTLNLFNYMFTALYVLYVSTELGLSPGLLGLVIGIGAIGALLGAAVTGRLVRRLGIGRTVVISFVLFPAPLVLVPLAGGSTPVVLGVLFASEFLSGLGLMMMDITVGSLQTAVIPERLLARVAGAKRTVNYGIRPIGAVLGGTLGATLGVRPTLWIATVGAVTGLLWVLPTAIPKLRELPEPDHAAAG